MLTILYARAGQDTRRELLERLGKGQAARRLLLVPENDSHESERAMCRVLGNRAAQGCEVLSLSRLAGRLTDAAGGGAAPVLDEGGRMLLMYAALRQVADQLKLYRAPSRKPAFLTGLLATVDECRASQVPPQRLIQAGEENGGQQGDKWRDIGLIYAAYEALAAQSAADPRDRLDRLAQQLRQTGWAQGAQSCVLGFTDFCAQEEEVLMALAAQGDLTVALTGGREEAGELFRPGRRAAARLLRRARQEGIPVQEQWLERPRQAHPSLTHLERYLFGPLPPPWQGECRVYRTAAADPRREVEGVAAQILGLLRQDGLRCRDIVVCARSMDVYGELIGGVFEQYGIPVFRSAMEDVLQKPVLALVTAALSAAAEDYPYEEIFRYLKTDLTGLSRGERDALENYVLTWNIRGSQWRGDKPWQMHPEGYGLPFTPEQQAHVAWLDGLRRRVIAPLEKLRRNGERTGRGWALALYDLLEDINLPARLGERAAALEGRGDLNTAGQYRQLWDILVGGLEQCALLLRDTQMELEEFARLFSLVLSQYDVGTIPVSLDRVTVGEAPRMVNREAAALFYLGMDSTCIPSCPPEPGLLSDQDRLALAGLAVELGLRQEEKLAHELTAVYEVCAVPTQRLYLSYAQAGEGGEARTSCFLWPRLAALFPEEPERPADPVASRLAAPRPALELMGRSGALAALLGRLPETAGRAARLAQAGQWRRGSLSPAGVRALYGPVVPMSATRLDTYHACHFQYFLRFGLGAKPRRSARFRPSDYGTFAHAVLEQVLRRGQDHGGVAALAADPGLCQRLAQEAAQRYEQEALAGLEGESARLRYLFQRMKGAVVEVTRSVVDEMAASDFTPTRFELGFGQGKELPPVEVDNGVTLRLTGFVDRVDEWVDGGVRYLRVVDYKTGKKSFDFADLEDGRGLQMLLYLFALTRHAQAFGPEPVQPAGVLYIPARNPLVDGERTMTPAQVDAARGRQLRRQGLVLAEEPVLEAMEHGPGGRRFLPDRPEFQVSRAQMEELDRFVTRTLRQAAGNLAAGRIEADPFWRDGEHNACRWCDYQAACHFEPACGDSVRYRRGLAGEEFWSWLSRQEEGEEHGR